MLYVYGIVRRPDSNSTDWGTGVGDPPRPVFLIPHDRVAAAVSSVDAEAPPGQQVRGMRRDMAAHSAVLNRLFEAMTVLPAQFGNTVQGREALVERILQPQYKKLDEQLEALAGTAELTLHVRYREQAVLQELGRRQPALAARAEGYRRRQMSHEEKLDRGRQIAEAIYDLGEHESQRLLRRLEPLAREVKPDDRRGELTVLKASFLVDREDLEKFDRQVESLHAEMQDRMEFDYVGPLPPYSFTSVDLPAWE